MIYWSNDKAIHIWSLIESARCRSLAVLSLSLRMYGKHLPDENVLEFDLHIFMKQHITILIAFNHTVELIFDAIISDNDPSFAFLFLFNVIG